MLARYFNYGVKFCGYENFKFAKLVATRILILIVTLRYICGELEADGFTLMLKRVLAHF